VHFFLTGHTGFKGTWLTHLLCQRGHKVSGYSNHAFPAKLFTNSIHKDQLELDFRGDIRDGDYFNKCLAKSKADVVIHLAAQSLVPKSYIDPLETFSTNVDGTRNVLLATRANHFVKALLVITSDKVYRNRNSEEPHREVDPLGGHDPYSASKAMADIMTQSFMKLNDFPPIGIARAGNVVGGGDHGERRLIPDIIQAIEEGTPLELRRPSAIRPWQHVLDCLNGYLVLVERLLKESESGIWNVGPELTDLYTVETVVETFLKEIQIPLQVKLKPGDVFESEILKINSDKLRRETKWSNKLSFFQTIQWTAQWYRSNIKDKNASSRELMEDQIANFEQI
jgi:CDP-glucose 4,6-dehydratase